MIRDGIAAVRLTALACIASAVLASCGGASRTQSGAFVPLAAPADAAPLRALGLPFGRRSATSSVSSGKIQHVVFIIQENRSFDNLFQGFPGADTASSGLNSFGQTIKLTPISLAAPYGIDHSSIAFFTAYDNGKLDGWNLEQAGPVKGYPHPQYGFVPHSESKLYFDMASQYVLADRMYASNIDASYVSHQYAIAGQANRAVDFPSSFWKCAKNDKIQTLNDDRTYGKMMNVCQNYETLGDELDKAGLTWRYYAYAKDSIWTAYGSINHIFHGPDWRNVIGSSAQVITDVQNGKLANVTWVTPTGANSDHAGSVSKSGPFWVASVVNAIGESEFWNSTAVFIMWDEWGGWYDHVAPRYKDFDGLGFRVPLLVISPYAKNYVSHIQYEHGSVLRFIEDNFGLAQMAASDTRASDPGKYEFSFTKPPRAFKPFETSESPDYFVQQERMQRQGPPDDE